MVSAILLGLALVRPALASSEVELKANRFVALLVDGERVKHPRKGARIEGGPHVVQIRGAFGRIRHHALIDVPDHTRMDLRWAKQALSVRMLAFVPYGGPGEADAETEDAPDPRRVTRRAQRRAERQGTPDASPPPPEVPGTATSWVEPPEAPTAAPTEAAPPAVPAIVPRPGPAPAEDASVIIHPAVPFPERPAPRLDPRAPPPVAPLVEHR